jgi:hypothetical protein
MLISQLRAWLMPQLKISNHPYAAAAMAAEPGWQDDSSEFVRRLVIRNICRRHNADVFGIAAIPSAF